MARPISVLHSILTILPTITALPITHLTARTTLLKRARPSNKSLSIALPVTFAILSLCALIFYLTMPRATFESWFCRRKSTPPPTPQPSSPHVRSPTVLSEKISLADPDQFKTRISCPMSTHSTALPELSPVEAGAGPKFEIDSKIAPQRQPVIHEMGDGTPRRPPSAATVRKSGSFGKGDRKSRYRSRSRSNPTRPPTHRRLTSAISVKGLRKSTMERTSTFYRKSIFHFSDRRGSIFDRGSWFCQSAMEVEHETRRGRETSVDTLPAYPGPAVVRDSSETMQCVDEKEWMEGKLSTETEGRAEEVEGGTKRKREPTMDWSGMEWLRGVYSERKSKRRSFYPRDEKAEDEKSEEPSS
ncbi:hypothetical protein K458DRAFT_492512 [Lentithecium fluviatile CBS 122367]|uniref:Uncharacterized protein n=1 Tax=Lentithecium fluviatile CBS 122367 TaxID=1168545 RepID=A0A6G1IDL2_9PLEO|nr:hypothetical protein K458DRAFT_492512 [Lentithecium fluviatile CBS 122367]